VVAEPTRNIAGANPGRDRYHQRVPGLNRWADRLADRAKDLGLHRQNYDLAVVHRGTVVGYRPDTVAVLDRLPLIGLRLRRNQTLPRIAVGDEPANDRLSHVASANKGDVGMCHIASGPRRILG